MVTDSPLLTGPNYSVRIPPGFRVVSGDPSSGQYLLVPPGSSALSVDAVVTLRAIAPFQVSSLLQNIYTMENPMVAMMSTASLGIASITNMAPARQVKLAQGLTHIREFEGVLLSGFPVRDMELVIQGPAAAVEVNIMVNLFRWAEFMGPCLQILAGIELAGSAATPGADSPAPTETSVRAVVDKSRPEQVEYQLVHSGVAAAIATLPTEVKGRTVVNINHLVVARSISGADVVLGDHTGTEMKVEGNMSGQFVEGNNNRVARADHDSQVTIDDHSVNARDIEDNTGVAIGAGAQVTMSQENRDEILKLLQQLQAEIQAAPIGEGAKNALSRSVPELQQAVQSKQPQDGIKNGLSRINDQLEAAGAVAGNVSGIVQTLSKIAAVAGVGIKLVAPFVASLL